MCPRQQSHLLTKPPSRPVCDDAERCSRLVELGGAMILGTVDMLVKAGMFNADSPIRNLGLVLALFLRWVDSVVQVSDYFQDEARWAAVLVALAEEHGVTIDGPFILTEALERLPDLEDVPRGVQTKWKRIKWRGQVSETTPHPDGQGHAESN